jgi:hypothetical protein
MTEYKGYTKKFTIYGAESVECYLKIGLVGPDHWERFPHLSIGDICFLDMTVSKQADELRVYEVLFAVVNKLIECGGNLKDVIGVLRDQQMFPRGTTDDPNIPMCKSIADYVARYLEGRI